MGLQQFERRLERLVEGAFDKAFRSGLQPVELGRRLSREMALQRTVGVHAAGSLHLPYGSRVAIGDEPVTIGRHAECDVVLDDTNISRRHAEVRRQGEDYMLVDLGSTNGSKVNGTRVKQQALADGDEITLGKTVLRFEAS